jgi:hypothetical protein
MSKQKEKQKTEKQAEREGSEGNWHMEDKARETSGQREKQ